MKENPMLNRLQHMIQRLANGRAILILLGTTIALRVIMGLPNDPFGLNPHLARLGGAEILDMQIGYKVHYSYLFSPRIYLSMGRRFSYLKV